MVVVVVVVVVDVVVVCVVVAALPVQLFSQSRSGQNLSNRLCFHVFWKLSEQKTP